MSRLRKQRLASVHRSLPREYKVKRKIKTLAKCTLFELGQMVGYGFYKGVGPFWICIFFSLAVSVCFFCIPPSSLLLHFLDITSLLKSSDQKFPIIPWEALHTKPNNDDTLTEKSASCYIRVSSQMDEYLFR
jgi:hypothetical protein